MMCRMPEPCCPRCSYPICVPDPKLCSECGLIFNSITQPHTRPSFLYGYATRLWHPYAGAADRTNFYITPLVAMLLLSFAIWLATIGIEIRWNPGAVDDTGKCVWLGRVEVTLCHWGRTQHHIDNGELNLSPLNEALGVVERAMKLGHFPCDGTKITHFGSQYRLRYPNGLMCLRLYLSVFVLPLSMSILAVAFPLTLARIHLHPAVSADYHRLVRRRISTLAWRAAIVQAFLITGCAVYDLLLAPWISWPATNTGLFGFEMFAGIIIFELMMVIALNSRDSDLFLSNRRFVQIGHAVILMIVIFCSVAMLLVGE